MHESSDEHRASSRDTSPSPETGDVHPVATAATGREQHQQLKIPKKRAPMACTSCRARKVRCNVVHQNPCSNCTLDNQECVTPENPRRRLKSIHRAQAISGSYGPGGPLQAASSAVGKRSATLGGPRHVVRPPMPSGALENYPLNPALLSAQFPEPTLYRPGHASTFPSGASPISSATSQLLALQRSASTQISPHRPSPVRGGSGSGLPGFIRPLPDRLQEDVSYLRARDALALPTVKLQNALVHAFVEFVYPNLPVVDWQEFVDIVGTRDGSRGQVSLLLYQAIMFSATAFVDLETLREANFPNIEAARRAFFQRARILYDFDTESNRLVLIQSLLLMANWYESPDNPKDTWHWMGVAISLAHTMGLHRNPATHRAAAGQEKLRKRIWWSCFMRDRLIALAMRRTMRIKEEDFDVPMLTEEDFDLRVPATTALEFAWSCPVARSLAVQQQLAQICVQQAKLCVLVGQVIRLQYSVLLKEDAGSSSTATDVDSWGYHDPMLLPYKSGENLQGVEMVANRLTGWLRDLPSSSQYRTLAPADGEHGAATLAVHRSLLHMVYHTTVSALHRPHVLLSAESRTIPQVVQEASRDTVRQSARWTSLIASQLHGLQLDRYMPTSGVTVLLPAMIVHLLDVDDRRLDIRERARKDYVLCLEAMKALCPAYAAARYAISYLKDLLKKHNQVGLVNMATGGAPTLLSTAPFAPPMPTGPMMRSGPARDRFTTPPPDHSSTSSQHALPQATTASVLAPHTVSLADIETSIKLGLTPPYENTGREGDRQPLQFDFLPDLDLAEFEVDQPDFTQWLNDAVYEEPLGSEDVVMDFGTEIGLAI